MGKIKKGAVVKTAFDEYTLIKQVGSGGNGSVFSAKNTDEERFAIKFLDRNIGKDKLKRFRNEIAFCEQHRHKNIVPVLDHGYAELDGKDYVFYVMPLYAETLKNKIKAGVSPDEAIDIFIGMLSGLKYAHEHNAIHRDVKPENILFAKGSSEPVICDFGIAHFAEEDLLTAIETKPGDRMANFYYAAPEQYKRDVVTTPQTDVYSAALILNEMFTREIPQAKGYKKIADVDADYVYLDEVFDQLYKQNPDERLYTEARIISEMKVRAEIANRTKEKEKLQNMVVEMTDPGEFETKIINKNYRDGKIVFVFDKVIPEVWHQYIRSRDYSHSCIMGYGPEKLMRISENELAMPLYGTENEDTIKTIIKDVGDWVKITNNAYNRREKRNAREAQERKERERKAAIKLAEKKNAFETMMSEIV